jgi:hypothetical protein
MHLWTHAHVRATLDAPTQCHVLALETVHASNARNASCYGKQRLYAASVSVRPLFFVWQCTLRRCHVASALVPQDLSLVHHVRGSVHGARVRGAHFDASCRGEALSAASDVGRRAAGGASGFRAAGLGTDPKRR